MHRVVQRHRPGVNLAASGAGRSAGKERQVRRDRQYDQLPPAGVLGQDGGERQPRREQTQEQIERSFQALMKSSTQSYISVAMTRSLILVVEDDARLAATLERVLAAEGHDVSVAGDGVEG